MSDITWAISIIAQYTDTDRDVVNAFQDLLASIVSQPKNAAIRYFIYKYNLDKKSGTLLTINYNPAAPHTWHEKPLPQFDILKKVTISAALTNHTLSQTHNKHILITWGHGAGFGFFPQGLPPEKTFKKIRQEQNILSNIDKYFSKRVSAYSRHRIKRIVTSSFKRPSTRTEDLLMRKADRNEPFRLFTIEEVKEVLQNSYKAAGQEVVILYMMSCLMQSFETGYTLRPHVKYLIGSQNFTFFFGIDYRSLFNLLHTNPSIDEKILIEDIIRKFPLKYDSREILQQLTASQRKFIDTLSLSANDLSRYNQLLDAIEDLARAFLNAPHKKRLYEIISAARAECKDVNFNGSHLGFIDLTHFCKRLLLFIGNNPTINQPIHKIISLAEGPGKLIAGNYTPTILCDVSTDGSALCPNGFSIFFPKNDADEDYIVYFLQNFYQPHVSGGILTSSYRDAAKWIEFVNDFHDLS